MAKKTTNSGGAPKGNFNAAKTGASLSRSRLAVGELPHKMIAVKREGRKYRRMLEGEVLRVHGQISPTLAHYIDSASAATVHAGICRWLLRHNIETMSTSEIMACSNAIVKAKADRDRAVEALELDLEPDTMTLRAYAPIVGRNG